MTLITDTFIDDLFELDSFIYCSIQGLGYGSIGVELTDKLKALGMPELQNDHAYLRRRKHFENLEGFATKEAEEGHPYLFGLASIKVCSILEAAVDHILLELLRIPGTIDSNSKLPRVKVPLIEFMGATELERMIYLRDALKHEMASDLKIGVGRFESVVDTLGLSGTVAPSVRKALLELREMRNVIVHNMAKADRFFKIRCPWIAVDVGQSLRVTQVQHRAYHTAALWYLIELDQRWQEKITMVGRGKDAEDLLNELETEIASVPAYGPARNRPDDSTPCPSGT
jgi:hypothetical protein